MMRKYQTKLKREDCYTREQELEYIGEKLAYLSQNNIDCEKYTKYWKDEDIVEEIKADAIIESLDLYTKNNTFPTNKQIIKYWGYFLDIHHDFKKNDANQRRFKETFFSTNHEEIADKEDQNLSSQSLDSEQKKDDRSATNLQVRNQVDKGEQSTSDDLQDAARTAKMKSFSEIKDYCEALYNLPGGKKKFRAFVEYYLPRQTLEKVSGNNSGRRGYSVPQLSKNISIVEQDIESKDNANMKLLMGAPAFILPAYLKDLDIAFYLFRKYSLEKLSLLPIRITKWSFVESIKKLKMVIVLAILLFVVLITIIVLFFSNIFKSCEDNIPQNGLQNHSQITLKVSSREIDTLGSGKNNNYKSDGSSLYDFSKAPLSENFNEMNGNAHQSGNIDDDREHPSDKAEAELSIKSSPSRLVIGAASADAESVIAPLVTKRHYNAKITNPNDFPINVKLSSEIKSLFNCGNYIRNDIVIDIVTMGESQKNWSTGENIEIAANGVFSLRTSLSVKELAPGHSKNYLVKLPYSCSIQYTIYVDYALNGNKHTETIPFESNLGLLNDEPVLLAETKDAYRWSIYLESEFRNEKNIQIRTANSDDFLGCVAEYLYGSRQNPCQLIAPSCGENVILFETKKNFGESLNNLLIIESTNTSNCATNRYYQPLFPYNNVEEHRQCGLTAKILGIDTCMNNRMEIPSKIKMEKEDLWTSQFTYDLEKIDQMQEKWFAYFSFGKPLRKYVSEINVLKNSNGDINQIIFDSQDIVNGKNISTSFANFYVGYRDNILFELDMRSSTYAGKENYLAGPFRVWGITKFKQNWIKEYLGKWDITRFCRDDKGYWKPCSEFGKIIWDCRTDPWRCEHRDTNIFPSWKFDN